jgi:methyl-CpG-binding domain protein 4
MPLPCTPPAKRRAKKSPVTPSPYFSPSSLRVATNTEIQLPKCVLFPSTENALAQPEKPEQDALRNDPLFCYHSRAFVRRYQQLILLKPVMIQGCNILLLSGPFRLTLGLSHRLETVADDPWKLLISVTLLNKTSGKLAIPIFWEILDRWPTPLALSQGVAIVTIQSGNP